MEDSQMPQSLHECGQVNASELSKELLDHLLDKSGSFTVRAVGDLSEVVSQLEMRIEEKAMTCRVYTENRAIAASGALIFPVVGLPSVALIAAHNAATWDPHYEIGKNKFNNTVSVTNKKPSPATIAKAKAEAKAVPENAASRMAALSIGTTGLTGVILRKLL